MQDFALSYEKILQYIALHPDQPCPAHCSAGKDLTGAFTAPPLMLLGVEDSIVEDYAPTTIGLKQFLPVLMVHFNSQAVYEDNWKGTLNMGGSNPESTRGFITHVNKEHESVEEYFAKMTTLESKVLRMEKNALLVPVDT